MRFRKIAALLFAVACLPVVAHAAGVQLSSSTQYLWYQDFLSPDPDQDELAEYLRLNATDLDKDGKVSLFGYGRAIKQFSDSIEDRPELGDKAYGRLYYLYLDWRDVIKDRLDLRAGRTYVHTAAVSGTVDGGYVNLKKLGPLGATVFGGRRVLFDNKSEVGNGDESLVGGTVYFNTEKY
ncbi:MAG TPA: hypothetical protein VLA34_15200, partial [Candidatus Krumholzibacterium sp.]|nr:hypothetical protein [Candidatus Krumholzibacterium sp.]